jgi:hypothetical protein
MNQISAGTYERFGVAYPVNALARSPLLQPILDAAIEQIEAMLSWHSKVLMIRLDSHGEEYGRDNRRFSDIVRAFKREVKAEYKLSRVGHIWVSEIETSKRAHYHLVLLVDGNKIRSPWRINKLWEKWNHRYLVSPWFPGHMMIHRNDKTSIDQAVHWASYLAKARGKGYLQNFSKSYSVSHIFRRHC